MDIAQQILDAIADNLDQPKRADAVYAQTMKRTSSANWSSRRLNVWIESPYWDALRSRSEAMRRSICLLVYLSIRGLYAAPPVEEPEFAFKNAALWFCQFLALVLPAKISDFALFRTQFATLRGPIPLRALHAEEFAAGKPVNKETVEGFGKAALGDVNPRTSWRATKEFRLQIIGELARRGLVAAVNRAGGAL